MKMSGVAIRLAVGIMSSVDANFGAVLKMIVVSSVYYSALSPLFNCFINCPIPLPSPPLSLDFRRKTRRRRV